MNKNYISYLSPQYTRQQEAIKEVCKELDLIVHYPNYHADTQDKNTVLIYTKEANEYNKKLPEYARNEDYKSSICHFENSDCNNNFSLDWLNHGTIDCRGINEKERIKDYLINKLDEYNKRLNPI